MNTYVKKRSGAGNANHNEELLLTNLIRVARLNSAKATVKKVLKYPQRLRVVQKVLVTQRQDRYAYSAFFFIPTRDTTTRNRWPLQLSKDEYRRVPPPFASQSPV
jgi:hypothetical protein